MEGGVAPIQEAPKDKSVGTKKSEDKRPITIDEILGGNIQPEKKEYMELKELDTRFHTLKFSRQIGKNNHEFQLDDGTEVKLNRYQNISL